MYAVIKTGGKQYRVSSGEKIKVEQIPADVGSQITLDQVFLLRPAGGYQQYRSPVPGLWFCGAGAHPGGHVTGLPGANAAREALRHRAEWSRP